MKGHIARYAMLLACLPLTFHTLLEAELAKQDLRRAFRRQSRAWFLRRTSDQGAKA